ncbi:50S ribosomal protein L37ae [Candidatus Woesearchaeota archaeon]|nr:MAG: 50S ribosomal protein L37ae [Candidatus Woesearchaeota archaeon]
MAKTTYSTKRYGTRYGRRLREKAAVIEKEQRKSHKCPYCSYPKVKRIAAGIWQCGKCKAKFASRAYTITKSKSEVAA